MSFEKDLSNINKWNSQGIETKRIVYSFSVLEFFLMESFIQTITNQHIWESDEWNALKEEVPEVEKLHLRELLQVLNSIIIFIC